MDHELLKMLAHLRIVAKRAGLNCDLTRMLQDRAYAREFLDAAMTADNEELVFAALAMQDKMGLIVAAPQTAAAAEPKPEPKPDPTVPVKAGVDANKYKFGPRG
jgi:hypothetical protein